MNAPIFDLSVTLFDLPEKSKALIEKEFGSIAKLYMMVYDLEKETMSYYYPTSKENKLKIKEIHKSIDAIQKRIEKLGFDGYMILNEIAKDFAAMLIEEKLMTTDYYKKKFGGNYDEMKVWLETSLV